MTQYNSLSVKLSNSQLNKLKSSMKNETDVVLRISSNMVSNSNSLLEISPTNQVFLKTFNSEFQEVKVWFTDQTSKPLELEDKINIILIIK